MVTGTDPAIAGEIISIYCTGLGAVNPPAVTIAAPPIPPPQTVLPVQVNIGGASAQVTYAGLAPGFPGLYQINAQLPEGLLVTAGGATSNAVTVAIR